MPALTRALDAEGARLVRRATYASVATASFLVLVKLVAWQLTHSVSLLSSLVDSLLDGLASLVMLLAVRHALTPPDAEHRFGHGKAEPLAALGQAFFVAGSAVFLAIEALDRLRDPVPLQQPWVGIGVMLLSIAATFALTRYQSYVMRRARSLAVQADALHYLGDLLVNAGVLLALALAYGLGWTLADPIIALLVVLYIARMAWRILAGAVDMLMDRELPEAERQRIAELVRQEPLVRGLHELRTRVSGPQVFIQLHVEFDSDLSLTEAHAIADRLERRLSAAFGGAEVLIHQDIHGLARRAEDFGGHSV